MQTLSNFLMVGIMPFMKVIALNKSEISQQNQEINRVANLERIRLVKHKKGYKTLDDFTISTELTR